MDGTQDNRAPFSHASLWTRLRDTAAGFGRLAMPPHCLACGVPVASDGTLCPSCWGRMQLIERPFCERLGIPFTYDLGPGALSAEAIADPPPFGRLRAAAVFDEIARELVHGLKYHRHLDLEPLAARRADIGGELHRVRDAIGLNLDVAPVDDIGGGVDRHPSVASAIVQSC